MTREIELFEFCLTLAMHTFLVTLLLSVASFPSLLFLCEIPFVTQQLVRPTSVLSHSRSHIRLPLFYGHPIRSHAHARKAFAPEYVKNCVENTTAPYSVDNFSFARSDSKTLVSGQITFYRDLRAPLPFEFQLTKCRDKTDRNTCKLMNAFKWNDLCIWEILNPVSIIRTVLGQVEPPLRCPIRKGRYVFRNIKVETNTMAGILARKYGDRNLWIVRITMHEGLQDFVCWEIGAKITNQMTL